MEILEQLAVLGLVALAMVLGALVGWERERAHKPAGIRTNMLVAGAAAMVTALGRLAMEDFSGEMGDPTRALHAVVTGIGFIGGGAILRDAGGKTEGLTSAASIFFVAAVGAALGLGEVVLGGGAALLVVATLRGVKALERRFRT